ncbi:MAG: type I secretion C-terminal target domain-containing protein, partial [Rhodobiaceae bacterium]|nr:type I secretion C-terminal target domain-containing protein [Rhodobiaceae bacterium]
GNDTINGGDDDDTIVGGYGNDVLIGGDGGTNFDILDYYLEAQAYSSVYSSLPVGSVQGVKVDLLAAAAFDTFGDTDLVIGFEGVNGTDLEDILIGDDAANMLNGFGGSDNIRGGKGADTLTGDSGVDTFAYKDGDVDAVDTITDFDLANDQFDLAGLLDAAFTPGDTADYVKAVTDSTDTTVSVDFDGAANGVNFVDVAVLTGITAGNITFVYDDASNTTTVTIA